MPAYLTSIACAFVVVIATAYVGEAAESAPQTCEVLNGINLSGGEFGRGYQGREGKDFIYPTAKELEAAKRDGFSVIRIPFRWERVQPDPTRDPDARGLRGLDNIVSAASNIGLPIILDMHNSAFYRDQNLAGNAYLKERLVSFWVILAKRYQSSSNVIIGIMNEPHKIDADEWASVAQSAITAIRGSGFKGKILAPGTIWSGAHSWSRKVGLKSNAEALSKLEDPLKNTDIDIHQYYDADFSGTQTTCRPDERGVAAIQEITNWLRTTGQKGFLSEYGSSSDNGCLKQLEGTLEIIRDNSDVWSGSTYWSGGRMWSSKYPYVIDTGRNLGDAQYQSIRPFLCGKN